MGPKQSRANRDSALSLNPNERRRLTSFLESRGSRAHLNRDDMHKIWTDLLVPDLLKIYGDFLMKQDISKKNYIGIDEFALLYSALVRGDAEEKATTIVSIVDNNRKNSTGHPVVSFNKLLKYFGDLLESYFLGLKTQNDYNYKTWTNVKHPERSVIEEIISGVCSDLQRKNDDVQVQDLERWLNFTGMVSVLHSYVLGSLYHLEPELKATVVPTAVFPTSRTPTILDLSQVVYLNSFLPSDNKENWRFLFSTATHGESYSKMVGCMANQGPILVVIESDDNSLFGGFISESVGVGPRWVGTDDSFLYKLRPTVEVFPATGYNDHYVYLNMHQSSLPNGLGMGGQYGYWGLWLDSHFGRGECSESCTTYKNYNMLASIKRFHVNRLEIWGVGEIPPTAAEKGERTTGNDQISILQKDTAATRIMEMAGHKTYSKGVKNENPDE